MHTGSASVNGRLSPLSEATIPLTDRGFLFGHAIFETLLVLNGQVIFWDDHMERLRRGCQRARLNAPLEADLWSQTQLVVAHNVTHTGEVSPKMQLRIIVTGGNEVGLWSDLTSALTSNVAIFCRNIPGPTPQTMSQGVSLRTVPDTRSLALVDIKSNSYLAALLSFAQVREEGFDDALYVNGQGEITESTTANILWLAKDGGIHTTPTQGRCLPGTTAVGLQRALEKQGRTLHHTILRKEDFDQIDGMGIVSSTRGVVPVRAIDEYSVHNLQHASWVANLNEILLREQLINSRSLS